MTFDKWLKEWREKIERARQKPLRTIGSEGGVG